MEQHSDSTSTKPSETTYINHTTLTHIFVLQRVIVGHCRVLCNVTSVHVRGFFFIWTASGLDGGAESYCWTILISYADNVYTHVCVCVNSLVFPGLRTLYG